VREACLDLARDLGERGLVVTARSASTLRSISMLARFRPDMNAL
jgi:hypothetical protein